MHQAKIDFLISDAPLSVESCRSFISNPGCGGEVVFIGTVRNLTNNKEVKRLEFEAYESMALKEMEKIATHILDQTDAFKIAIHHRVGILEIGDIPVIIGVSSPHRASAFEACQYAIDTLKETVPIWKKEIFADGEVWVAAHP